MTYRELLIDMVESITPSMLKLSESEYEGQKAEVMHEAEATGREHVVNFMEEVFFIIDIRRAKKVVLDEG